ncbi:DUF3515 family protein [Plantibacter sp. CFBP 8798]|uniref:DUF3515 family protein n=1 Tax=Plantibacter sp. CFBP 8798 TaxID=2775268 RepID=UPI0017802576|nr:DUF3515 family protein [Plantibacter sp. CFBP 8798]MBD8466706.1 DUF3515 family protein [Plantibacter sp. CFBP 8798]
MSPIRALLATALAAAATLALAGCAPAVALEPAADANNPQCAEVTVRLPDVVAELPERGTDAQATGAWGDPATVLLHCGVAIPGPTTQQCQSVNGVDWIIDDADAPNYRFTTFGRTPAVEIVLDGDAVASSTVLADLAPAVSVLPVTGKCTALGDAELPIPTDG